MAAEIQKLAPTVEALSNLVVPGLGNIEQHIVDVYGGVASAVHAAGDAAAANGVSVSLDAQLAMAQEFCEKRGLRLVETYVDTMSGQSSDRPDFLIGAPNFASTTARR